MKKIPDFLSQAFEKSREAIMVTDQEDTIILVNPAFVEVTGYSANEILGKKQQFMRSKIHEKDHFENMDACLEEMGEWHREVFFQRKNEEIYPSELSVFRYLDDKKKLSHHVNIFSDISDKKQSDNQVQNITNYDGITGLPNRFLFKEHMQMAVSMAARKKNYLAILLLDLDRFKVVNDTFGHDLGDKLLKEVGVRLSSCVRGTDTLGYMGGDEFAITLTEIDSSDNAAMIARKILEAFKLSFHPGNQEMFVSTSIGITVFPTDGKDMDSLLKNADTALYQAKDKGKSDFEFYSPEMLEQVNQRLRIENDLHKAIKNDEFFLVYQPKIDLQNGKVCGMEALIRWVHPEKGFIPPDEFIYVAEETDLIAEIGQWVLNEACRQMVVWKEMGYKNLRMAVNVAAGEFAKPNYLEKLMLVLEKTGVNPFDLELELTERMIMDNVEDNILNLKKIKELGVHISIDDFGTGYSSLGYLRRFPIDSIKIDKSFIDDIPDDSDAGEISKAIIALAHSLRLYVVAEGVETREQLDFLVKEKCDQLQGYFFSKPLKQNDFTDLLVSKKELEL